MQTRLHDNIGSAEKEATDDDSRVLSFGFEQVTQLDQSSIDQSRELGVPRFYGLPGSQRLFGTEVHRPS